MGFAADGAMLAACVAGFALVVVGIFSSSPGSGISPNGWFPWHPTMMSLAFLLLMPVARWAYVADPMLGTKQQRRTIHAVLMGLGVVAAATGYLAIFLSNLPARKFLGYDFANNTWDGWRQVAHAWCGYLTLLLVLTQAVLGPVKLWFLQSDGGRIFRFHGLLGEATLLLSTVVLILAISFFGWHFALQALVGLFVVLVAVGVVATSGLCRAQPKEEDEEKPLLQQDAA